MGPAFWVRAQVEDGFEEARDWETAARNRSHRREWLQVGLNGSRPLFGRRGLAKKSLDWAQAAAVDVEVAVGSGFEEAPLVGGGEESEDVGNSLGFKSVMNVGWRQGGCEGGNGTEVCHAGGRKYRQQPWAIDMHPAGFEPDGSMVG